MVVDGKQDNNNVNFTSSFYISGGTVARIHAVFDAGYGDDVVLRSAKVNLDRGIASM